ncbi:hypothetical protein CORC01_10569 [Colletotrichum orchidophilum]|uniref:Mid2 domain-containing protein n=1 Tax=Colletotrichum orchidophilum TaxID=1209926 RepID=A0A1G4AYJ2_9PEZI|nr:uncharacterized protein CORC01_10569 [Colletotrichum orchidophilum]OHE94112.1 hypothetical protein CORC01_10569 [Colletotrichum orchidophilum]
MSRPAGIILSLFCLLALFASLSNGIDCYNYRGQKATDQQQCSGSDACCGSSDTCLPNRLCSSAKNAPNILIRGPCLKNPWSSNCAEICVFEETASNTGLQNGVYPRVEICDESIGKYCCRDGETGCCDNASRITYLDDNGNRVSAPPTSTTSSSTATATTTSATSAETTSNSPTSTTSPANGSNSSDGESLALKVGLGVGIPLAAIVAAVATWIFLRAKRRNKREVPGSVAPVTNFYHDAQEDYAAKNSTYQYGQDADFRNRGQDRRYEMHEMASADDSPQELMGSEVREMR